MAVTDYTTLKPEAILLNDDYEPRHKPPQINAEEEFNSRNHADSRFNKRSTTTSKKKRALLITMPGSTRAVSGMKIQT